FQAEDGIRGFHVTGVQTCALPISLFPVASTVSAQVHAPLLDYETATAAEFPHALTFTLRATAPEKIVEARVRYRVEQLSCVTTRSEERRVGKEWGCRWAQHRENAK